MDKKTVNDRVIIALKYLMKLRPDLTKTMLSELLDITNSTLSHILGSRMNASVDLMTCPITKSHGHVYATVRHC